MKSETEIAEPHLDVYESLYTELNPNYLPEVDANTSAQFLKKSSVNVLNLSQIWELSDYRKKGSLDKLGAFIAFKLVAGVQQGFSVDSSVLNNSSLDAPQFSTCLPNNASNTSHPLKQRSASVVSKTSLIGDWSIETAEQSKYESIFYSLNPVNGKLSGEQCRSVLLNSQLPQLQLAKIWELSDIDRDGQLDKYEMCVALHLVYKCLQNEPLPDHLPSSLIHPMKRFQCSIPSSPSVSGTPIPMSQPMRRASSTNAVSPLSRMPLSLNSRTSSISSLPKALGEANSSGGQYSSINSIFDPKVAQGEIWPINVTAYESIFQQIDTDHDGLVNGTDARNHLINCGLPQPVLAQIWTLVDTAKIGCLNIEQFALVNQLINEFQCGVQLPNQLPIHLIPPSIRSRTAVSRVSSSGNSLGNISIGGSFATFTNPRINELTDEIEKAMEIRRKAEQDLFQLEADTLVKNSEIKNLEIEVQTMSSTVKQLQYQKGEANKRLLDLDNRIVKLEGVCEEHSERLAAEEERLNKVKQEILEANENLASEEELLQTLQNEAKLSDKKYAQAKHLLVDENAKIERLVDELTAMERQTDVCSNEILRVEKLTAELSELIKQFETADKDVNVEDTKNGVLSDEELILKQFERIILNTDSFMTPTSKLLPAAPTFSSDLFKDDPFENADDIRNSFGADPFIGGLGGRSSITASGGCEFGELYTDDPFSSSSVAPNASSVAGEFANFSNFS